MGAEQIEQSIGIAPPKPKPSVKPADALQDPLRDPLLAPRPGTQENDPPNPSNAEMARTFEMGVLRERVQELTSADILDWADNLDWMHKVAGRSGDSHTAVSLGHDFRDTLRCVGEDKRALNLARKTVRAVAQGFGSGKVVAKGPPEMALLMHRSAMVQTVERTLRNLSRELSGYADYFDREEVLGRANRCWRVRKDIERLMPMIHP